MANTVIGFFDDAIEAQKAVEQLIQNGFSRENIDVSSNNGMTSGTDITTDDTRFGNNANRDSDLSALGTSTNSTTNSMAPDGNYQGNDTEKGNAVTRFFKNLFGDDDDNVERYSTVAQRSGAMVTVHAQTDDEAERAADLLDDAGAVDVDEKASEYGYGSTGNTSSGNQSTGSQYGYGSTGNTTTDDLSTGGLNSNRSITDGALNDISLNDTVTTGSTGVASADTTSYNNDASTTGITSSDNTGYNSGNNTSTDREGVIQVVKEELEVGKRTVQTGGVRVRSRIVQRPVEENIRLREERVTVERKPVDRVVTGDELANFQEQNIELTESAEVPVVNKQARVVEEIRVSKDATEREETIHDTVRNTEVDVENLEGNKGTTTSDYDTNSR